METQGREQLFMKIIVFFSVVTALTGIINLANSGELKLGDLGSGDYMQVIPGQISPNINSGTTGGSTQIIQGTVQDYTITTGYDQNFTKISTEFLAGDTFLRSDGIGYVSIYTPILYPQLAYLDLIGVTPTDNIYDVTYHVYNQFEDSPFYTLVGGSEIGNGFVSGFYVEYDLAGISAVHTNAIGNPMQFIAYPYASDGQTIETKFNPTDQTVEVYIDGNDAGTLTDWNYNGVTPVGSTSTYNGGVAASSPNFRVSEIDSNFQIIKQNPGEIDILGGIAGFFSLIASMLGLTSNALVPFWLWAIIGIPCLATLVYMGAELIRGD